MRLSRPLKALEQFRGQFWTDKIVETLESQAYKNKLFSKKLTFPPHVRRTTRVPSNKNILSKYKYF